MRRRQALAVLALGLWSATSFAQSRRSIRRVGVLASAPQPYHEAFRQGLHDMGYVEGKTIVLQYRYADGRDERLPALAHELVASGVEVIVAAGSAGTAAALAATRTIPIVSTGAADPVRSGFAASYARPGGNVTGIASLSQEACLKRVELLDEAVPGLKRMAVVWNPRNVPAAHCVRHLPRAAVPRNIDLALHELTAPEQIPAALQSIRASAADSLMSLAGTVTQARRSEFVAFASDMRLPSIYSLREYVDQGGLMSFGVSFAQLHYRAAAYVDRILRGAHPSQLPIEQPSRFELAINLRTARALGIRLPRSILMRADIVLN